MSGVLPRLSWYAALITFVAFAGVSVHLGSVGVASCGCLGTIQTNPWWVFGADLVVLGVIILSRPKSGAARDITQPYGAWTGSVALGVGILIGAGSFAFGSVEAVMARLRGETGWVPDYVDFGSGKSGEMLDASATVANWTDEPLRLLGGMADCNCVTANDFPLTIPPNSKASFRIRLKAVGDTNGQLTRTITVRTDHPRHPQLVVKIGCRVVP